MSRMSEADPHEQIAQLEAQIEALAETLEGCRKIMLVARIAMAGGALLVLAMMLGTIRADLASLCGATAAVLGGIVLLGSNRSTADQALARMKKAEAVRSELIDRLELRPVGGGLARQEP
jgi:urea transporter